MLGLVALLQISVSDADLSKLASMSDYGACTWRLVSYLGGRTSSEPLRDKQLIEDSVQECSQFRAEALTDFRRFVRDRPEALKYYPGSSEAEIDTLIESDFDDSLRKTLEDDLAKIKRSLDAPNY